MKKMIAWLMVISFALPMAACGSIKISTGTAIAGASTPGSGEASLAMQIAVGTLKLEGTQYAVDAAQAAELIPLWKMVLSLGKSDTAAAEEMNGLVKQIQKSMTSEQIQAIQGFGLTAQNLAAITQELGVDFNTTAGNANSNSTASTSAGTSGGGMAGSPPPDAPGGIPGGDPGGGPGSPTSQSSQTESSGSVNFLGLNELLLDKVIQLLESKVQ
jgi:hypothetical protein